MVKMKYRHLLTQTDRYDISSDRLGPPIRRGCDHETGFIQFLLNTSVQDTNSGRSQSGNLPWVLWSGLILALKSWAVRKRARTKINYWGNTILNFR